MRAHGYIKFHFGSSYYPINLILYLFKLPFKLFKIGSTSYLNSTINPSYISCILWTVNIIFTVLIYNFINIIVIRAFCSQVHSHKSWFVFSGFLAPFWNEAKHVLLDVDFDAHTDIIYYFLPFWLLLMSSMAATGCLFL